MVHLVDDFVRGGNLDDFYVNFDAIWQTFVILVHGLLFDDFIVLARTGDPDAVTAMGKLANACFKGVANYAFVVTASGVHAKCTSRCTLHHLPCRAPFPVHHWGLCTHL